MPKRPTASKTMIRYRKYYYMRKFSLWETIDAQGIQHLMLIQDYDMKVGVRNEERMLGSFGTHRTY